jgi:hypothetical protein
VEQNIQPVNIPARKTPYKTVMCVHPMDNESHLS